VPVIVGDATDEDALRAAGIDRATSLIAALGDSSANLALVLTARSLREDLRIVARIADDRDARKFIRAGADRVVNPYDIGGSRMAAIAFRPHVAEFLDEVVHSEEHDVDIQEVTVAPGSPADGATIDAVCDALVIAVKSSADGYVFGPSTGRRLAAGDVMIVVGAAEQIGRLVAATRTSLGSAGPAPV
jgi:voltage-gated potassium channel